jgi:uncharacterized Ntn-hydrolase superfamily protein
MTFSIVGRSADGRSWGVAVASRYLAVGAVVPAAEAGAGALATQSIGNRAHHPQGLALLRTGLSASAVVAALVAADDGRDDRQLGVVDVRGGSATYTGSGCDAWAGDRSGPGYAVQGNLLTGADVVRRMEDAWLGAAAGTPLGRRLHAALTAGDGAGGDLRGRQASALLVVSLDGGHGPGADVVCDLRVDDHPDPVTELGRLLDLDDLLRAEEGRRAGEIHRD